MPSYRYAPLSTDPERPGTNLRENNGENAFGERKQERFQICVMFLVLAAIVYVLARAGGQDTLGCPKQEFVVANSGSSSDAAFDIGSYREKILSQSTPHIIECAEAGEGGSQEACHLPREKRYAALNQKGVTLWMTGLSGSGKSTIASLLEEQLVMNHGKSVYRLDGDNIRTGLNRDLGFSASDRGESVRRVGEMSCLLNDAGMITIVSLVSPYKKDRDDVRHRHEEQGLKFLEVFMDVPLKVVAERDPKGLYKKVFAGELKGFTGVDDPYEAPVNPELSIKNQEMSIQESVDIIMRKLNELGVLVGGPTHNHGLPFPDGDEIIDLHVPSSLRAARIKEAESLPRVLLSDIDVNWLQTVGEGWAAPLKGFMREGALLQTIHFNSMLVDPLNLTGSAHVNEMKTDFQDFKPVPPKRVSMSVPITLAATDYTKMIIESSGKTAVTLVNKHGQALAILRNPEIFANRKEEVVSRIFGVIDKGHPYIKTMYDGGPWCIGGEVELLDRIKMNDGLDKWRLTTKEVTDKFKQMDADAVFAFQTRNPTHAGHAYLMKTAGERLKKKGYKKPVLLLSPLGGWTKSDDVPLDVRVKQHEAVLEEKMLDPASTVMHIWPAPMIYAGPTEVLFHAKSRRNAGATYFVVGRDPAGMKGSEIAEASPDDDLYDGDHGRYVLYNSPGQDPMNMLSFTKVYYDTRDHIMKDQDPNRKEDFISISGTKMRALARLGATPCPIDSNGKMPTDLIGAKCVPPGFMVQKGWEIVCDYYQNIDSNKWVPYSVQNVHPLADPTSKHIGTYGKTDFALTPSYKGRYVSPWHDIPLQIPEEGNLFNFHVEIPMYSTAKMEMNKEVQGNPIMQDTSNGAPRFYHYGAPVFNYGFLPQTWESTQHTDPSTNVAGDNDPIDAIEIGPGPLTMGSTHKVKILGSLALIDGGETDHKVVVIRDDDPLFGSVNSMDDLERNKPGTKARIIDWMKNYKTAEGKGVNQLASETFTSSDGATKVVMTTHQHYLDLMAGKITITDKFYLGKN